MQDSEKISQPLISFIITVYNLPTDLVKECVESVLALNLNESEREIILVDDGSAESSLTALGDLASHLIYTYKENGGLSSARNTGIENANGKYIQFIDGDDCLVAENYNLIIGRIRSGAYNLVQFALTRDEDNSANLASRTNLFMASYGNSYLKQHNLRSSACSYIFCKSILNGLRFTEGILHEDEEFTPLLILNCGMMCHTSIKAYYYRLREDSIITATDAEHINKRFSDFLGIMVRLRQVASKNKYNSALKRRVNQMAMDMIYNSITIHKDEERVENTVSILRKYRFFPLPLRFYTMKYLAFAILSRFRKGRSIIFNRLSHS